MAHIFACMHACIHMHPHMTGEMNAWSAWCVFTQPVGHMCACIHPHATSRACARSSHAYSSYTLNRVYGILAWHRTQLGSHLGWVVLTFQHARKTRSQVQRATPAPVCSLPASPTSVPTTAVLILLPAQPCFSLIK